MSHLLEAPAGKSGRIRVKDGHFVNDRGRVRLHATNLTGPANFPTHAEAERLAARLARFGINCARLHYFDSSYGTFMLPQEQGILTEDFRTKRTFDPERRDRLGEGIRARVVKPRQSLHGLELSEGSSRGGGRTQQ